MEDEGMMMMMLNETIPKQNYVESLFTVQL